MLEVLSTLGAIAGLAWRRGSFLRSTTYRAFLQAVFTLTWADQFFNSILPGSSGGDVLKIYQVCRLAPDRKAAAASTVFVDRLSAVLALATLAAGALLIDPRPLALIPRPAFG
ncbi:MAG: lysylphosphatidylglycerol synthase domain-containing protein [Chthoniobacterales bacterium]